MQLLSSTACSWKVGHQEALACMQYDDYVTRNDLTAILKVMYPCPNIL